jgi:hypothetical protein
MRENGDGALQPGSTLAVGDQKAQKHADGRSALFRRCPSTPLTGIQDKLPQLVSIKPAWVFSQALQQLAQMKAVIIERGIAGAALLAHPAAERGQKDRIHDDLLYTPGRNDIGEPGISEKQKRTLSEVSPVCAAISWASASIQVPHELLDHPFVQSGDRFRLSDQSNGSGARPLECASEPLSLHSPPCTTPEQTLQASAHLGRSEVLGCGKATRKTLPT